MSKAILFHFIVEDLDLGFIIRQLKVGPKANETAQQPFLHTLQVFG